MRRACWNASVVVTSRSARHVIVRSVLGDARRGTTRGPLSVIDHGTEFARCDIALDISVVLAGVGRSRDDD
jgi:hypothetical protein